MTPSSISALEPGHFTLSCFLHSGTGGIVDDTVITRLFDDSYYLVTNATCRQKDLAYIHQQIDSYKVDSKQSNVVWDLHLDRDLIALQGPLSSDILQKVLGPTPGADLRRLYFGQCKVMSMDIPGKSIGGVIISRGGYTGEDGFELSILSTDVVQVAEHLLKSAGTDRLRLAGLGARDSLRLEAGMCLYGHDLDDDTTPVEAGLSWIVHRDRRANGGFHGAETILRQVHPTTKGGGPPRRRVGLIVEGAPAREGAEILTVEDAKSGETKVIGKVTSGCPSPTLGQNIAMGYIDSGWHKAGTKVGVLVRGKRRKAVVVKMPFVKSRYWKRPVIMPPG